MLVRLVEDYSPWGNSVLPPGSFLWLKDDEAAELIEAGLAIPVRAGVNEPAREVR